MTERTPVSAQTASTFLSRFITAIDGLVRETSFTIWTEDHIFHRYLRRVASVTPVLAACTSLAPMNRGDLQEERSEALVKSPGGAWVCLQTGSKRSSLKPVGQGPRGVQAGSTEERASDWQALPRERRPDGKRRGRRGAWRELAAIAGWQATRRRTGSPKGDITDTSVTGGLGVKQIVSATPAGGENARTWGALR